MLSEIIFLSYQVLICVLGQPFNQVLLLWENRMKFIFFAPLTMEALIDFILNIDYNIEVGVTFHIKVSLRQV